MANTLSCAVLRDLFGTPSMRAVFDSRAMVQRWLDAETALARAEADVGIVPAAAAARIAAEGDAARFDLDALRDGIAASQHPLVPLIRDLAERCGEHAGWVHWGATTQDIIDTGMVLQIREGLTLLVADVERCVGAATRLACAHAAQPMAGRTHGQHAVPITFGVKAAGWLDELRRCVERLRDLEPALTAQLGGAAGTLASLGRDADRVCERFAFHLELRCPSLPWHAARDRLRDVLYALDQLACAGERVGAEVIRLQATEVAELTEPATSGHVGSSTMPQKRNPMTSEYLVASARLVHANAGALTMGAAHAGERDMGLWAVEWLAVPSAFVLAASVADKLATVLEGMEVDGDHMRSNLMLTDGLLMAEAAMMTLAGTLGHEEAHELVSEAAKRAAAERRPLLAVLAEEPAATNVAAADLAGAMNPEAYVARAAHVARAVADKPAPAERG